MEDIISVCLIVSHQKTKLKELMQIALLDAETSVMEPFPEGTYPYFLHAMPIILREVHMFLSFICHCLSQLQQNVKVANIIVGEVIRASKGHVINDFMLRNFNLATMSTVQFNKFKNSILHHICKCS